MQIHRRFRHVNPKALLQQLRQNLAGPRHRVVTMIDRCRCLHGFSQPPILPSPEERGEDSALTPGPSPTGRGEVCIESRTTRPSSRRLRIRAWAMRIRRQRHHQPRYPAEIWRQSRYPYLGSRLRRSGCASNFLVDHNTAHPSHSCQ